MKRTKKSSFNVLAIDPGNKTGWKSPSASGVWDVAAKRDESKGMSLIRFKAKFIEVVKLEHITLVSYERPAGRNTSSIISISEKVGVLKSYCEKHGIDYKGFSSGEMKRFATGKGNCGKLEMIAACKKKYDYDPIDDNEADAIHLYYLTLAEYDTHKN